MSKLSRSRAARASARAIIGGGVCQTADAAQIWVLKFVHSLVDTDGMRPSHRSTLAAAAAVLALPVAAHAQLGLPLPDPTQVITQTTNTITDTVTGVISDPTG